MNFILSEKPQNRMLIRLIVKIICTVLLLFCLANMPYSYFELVRFVVMFAFIWLAYSDRKNPNKRLTIIWVISAVLINPLVKIHLGRTLWNIVDILWAIILLGSILLDRTPIKEKR